MNSNSRQWLTASAVTTLQFFGICLVITLLGRMFSNQFLFEPAMAVVLLSIKIADDCTAYPWFKALVFAGFMGVLSVAAMLISETWAAPAAGAADSDRGLAAFGKMAVQFFVFAAVSMATVWFNLNRAVVKPCKTGPQILAFVADVCLRFSAISLAGLLVSLASHQQANLWLYFAIWIMADYMALKVRDLSRDMILGMSVVIGGLSAAILTLHVGVLIPWSEKLLSADLETPELDWGFCLTIFVLGFGLTGILTACAKADARELRAVT